jgi:hypothetical protein
MFMKLLENKALALTVALWAVWVTTMWTWEKAALATGTTIAIAIGILISVRLATRAKSAVPCRVKVPARKISQKASKHV